MLGLGMDLERKFLQLSHGKPSQIIYTKNFMVYGNLISLILSVKCQADPS